MNNNDNSYAIDMSNIECGAQRENAYTPETYRAEMEQHQNAILNDLTVHFPSEQQIFQDDEPTTRWPVQRSYHDEDEVPMLMARIQALERINEKLSLSNEKLERTNKQLIDEALHNSLMYGPFEQQQQQQQEQIDIEEEEETTLMAHIQALESEKEQIKDMIQVLDHRKKELIELQQNDDYEMDIEEEGEEGEIIEPPVLERQSNGTPPLQPLNLFVDFDLEEEVEDDDDDSISSSSYGSMPSLVTIQEEEDEDEDDQNEQIVFVPTCWIKCSIPQNEDGQGTWRLVESSVSDEEEFNRPTKRARQEVL